jgi:catechol 2,3-dioxygenase
VSAFLPDETRISRVQLRTGDLDRALDFYTGVLGLRVAERPRRTVALSATASTPAMIVLSEEARATQRLSGTTGLYHFAIRYPSRRDLGHALQRLLRKGYPIQGGADHQVSEAIYLSDPDQNGVELYVDRPRSQWIWRGGRITMRTEPLDFDNLLASTEGEPGPAHVAPQTDLGHLHLNVADLAAAERFYREFLGLAVTQRSYPGALFLSVGGYHHHLAVNTWAGDRSPSANSIGLVSYRLEVPEAEILYCLRNRAPLAGYRTGTAIGENGSELLQIRDPNGHWLEVQHVRSPGLKSTEPKEFPQLINRKLKPQTEHENNY